MKNQIISFETAQIACEKGFNISTFFEYDEEKYLQDEGLLEFHGLEGIKAPTQSLLQKWLREKYNYHINIYYLDLTEKWLVEIQNTGNNEFIDLEEDIIENTFEEALEKGLQETLKRIK